MNPRTRVQANGIGLWRSLTPSESALVNGDDASTRLSGWFESLGIPAPVMAERHGSRGDEPESNQDLLGLTWTTIESDEETDLLIQQGSGGRLILGLGYAPGSIVLPAPLAAYERSTDPVRGSTRCPDHFAFVREFLETLPDGGIDPEDSILVLHLESTLLRGRFRIIRSLRTGRIHRLEFEDVRLMEVETLACVHRTELTWDGLAGEGNFDMALVESCGREFSASQESDLWSAPAWPARSSRRW